MIKFRLFARILKLLCVSALLLSLGACSSSKSSSALDSTVVLPPENVRYVPGAVEYVWEEPMVDVIDVPPGLDPEGNYYRPAHQEVIEIRQGRWKYYRQK